MQLFEKDGRESNHFFLSMASTAVAPATHASHRRYGEVSTLTPGWAMDSSSYRELNPPRRALLPCLFIIMYQYFLQRSTMRWARNALLVLGLVASRASGATSRARDLHGDAGGTPKASLSSLASTKKTSRLKVGLNALRLLGIEGASQTAVSTADQTCPTYVDELSTNKRFVDPCRVSRAELSWRGGYCRILSGCKQNRYRRLFSRFSKRDVVA